MTKFDCIQCHPQSFEIFGAQGFMLVTRGACIAQLVKRRTRMQKVVSLNPARHNIKSADSTGCLTASFSLVVISVQLVVLG
jgi:hypothetical protein